ncbi:MAG: choice-of-anchor B family protein [candidate division Zixibacteria bacterium]|nr:choice-of-anchor B family protein [candidate division Zixibacteria bacterium]
MSKRFLILLAAAILGLFSIVQADPPVLNSGYELTEYEKLFLKATNWPEQQATSEVLSDHEGPAIQATWIGATQWMSGRDNNYETFGGSIAKGVDFFGSSILITEYIPVEIIFDSDTANWSNIQVFRRDNAYNSAGVGTFPGSAWDISDTANPRRLNLCITEFEHTSTPPVNFHWDPDSSTLGNFEYLFIMNSSYDSTGTAYAGINILTGDPDILYAWWPRLATGHSYFETEPASIEILALMSLNAIAFENDAILNWFLSGASADHFVIFWGNSSPPTDTLVVLDGTINDYWHSGLTKNMSYFYQVGAYDDLDVEINLSVEAAVSTQEMSNQVNLVGYWNKYSNYGDCWGYVDQATGREYALICARFNGLSIIDIDTFPQVEVGFVPGTADLKDVKIYKNYAIIVSENASTKIVDLSDPSNPQQIAIIAGGRHNCMVDGDFVYFGGGSNGVVIYDISNPGAPQFAGQHLPYYYHDFAIRNDILAACAINGQGIDLLDVSNKASIQVVSQFNYPSSGAHNAAFSEDGNYIFIGDEVGGSGRHTRVFNISDYNNVFKVADIIIGAVAHNCYVREDKLLIAHYSEGVRIWNISDPTTPFEEGYFDPPGGSVWSVYPYYPSGRFIISDMINGLFVFESPLLPPPAGCCQGNRGDMNGDDNASSDILDLTYIVDLIFRGGSDISCPEEGDINGDGVSGNILDLTFVVDIIFRGGPPPGPCPL